MLGVAAIVPSEKTEGTRLEHSMQLLIRWAGQRQREEEEEMMQKEERDDEMEVHTGAEAVSSVVESDHIDQEEDLEGEEEKKSDADR